MIIVLAGLVSYGLLVWRAPQIVVGAGLGRIADAAQRATAEYNARVQVISVAGAIVVAIGLAFTARTYALNRRGQVTERFSKALERLGSDELYVRIGGVHALEHVMADSASHHADVIEVLVAFIRERAPRRRWPRASCSDQPGRWMHPPTPHEPSEPELPHEPAPDVQAALTTLGRRPTGIGRRERARIDLSSLHLARANLRDAVLLGVDLGNANLLGVDLGNANLVGAWLRDANLGNAYLGDANLSYTNLSYTNLSYANLHGAWLVGVDLRNTNLSDANLSDANLSDANLSGANLSGANLHNAWLAGVDLRNVDLRNVDLRNVDLRNVDLRNVDLRSARLDDARLHD